VTGRIYDRLVQQFGKERVFKDVDSIPIGLDYRKYLDKKVGRCSVFLAIIGRGWLEAKDTHGNLALNDPKDFVRIEIESALHRNIPVVPVLIQNSSIPLKDDLPENISELVYRQGIPVRSDPDFHRDMDRMIDRLHTYFEEEARKAVETRKAEAALNKKRRRTEAEAKRKRQEEMTLQEDDLEGWRGACQAHTSDAYKAYATSFPTGQYYDIAVKRYRKLKPFWVKDHFKE